MRVRVYIAGPMTGYENFNREAFHKAEEELKREGHTVLNPAMLPDGLTQPHYMDICMAMIRCVDAIYMLQGWQRSAVSRRQGGTGAGGEAGACSYFPGGGTVNIDATMTIGTALNTGLALLGWCYVMFCSWRWLSLMLLKKWNKRCKQTQRQKAMNAFFETFDIDSMEPGEPARVISRGDVVILVYRSEEKYERN